MSWRGVVSLPLWSLLAFPGAMLFLDGSAALAQAPFDEEEVGPPAPGAIPPARGRTGSGGPGPVPSPSLPAIPGARPPAVREGAPGQPGAERTGRDAAGRKDAARKARRSEDEAGEEAERKAGEDSREEEAPLSEFELQLEAYTDQLVETPVRQFGYDTLGRPGPPLVDTPVGPDYVLGTGDRLVISLWGSIDQDHPAVIDREGQVRLPVLGPVPLKGLTLERAEAVLKTRFDQQYKNYQLQLRVAGVRDMMVHVIGRVKRPARIRVASVSTILDALSGAGGVTKDGSLRKVLLRRGAEPPRPLDLYQYLLEGDLAVDVSLTPGDVVVVPPVGPRAAVVGRVLRPAIYELDGPEVTFETLLAMAGGYARLADRRSLQVESVSSRGLSVRRIDLEQTPPARVVLGDGDVAVVRSAGPRVENVVYLVGNVAAPGRYAFRPGMRVSDMVVRDSLMEAGFWLGRTPPFPEGPVPERPVPGKGTADGPGSKDEAGKRQEESERKGRFDLPEPFLEYALIQRLDPATQQETRIAFHLGKAILERDPAEDHLLQSQDTIVVFPRSTFEERRLVSISGAVNKPGDFDLFPGMRLRDLVRMSGGPLPEAQLAGAVLTRVHAEQGGARLEHVVVDLQAVLAGDERVNLPLERDDSLAVKVVPEYRKPFAVLIEGEVRQPGSYFVIPGERISDLLRRTGGFTEAAYLPGAQYYRESVRKVQEQRIEESLRRLETESKLAAQRYAAEAAATGEDVDAKSEQARVERTIASIRSTPARGRMVIRLGPPEKIAGTPDDLELSEGDRLVVPRRPQEVQVVGAVLNQSALIHQEGLEARVYLQECGGPLDSADMEMAYIIRADGSADGAQSARQDYQWDGSRGRYSRGNLLKSRLYPGDTLVIPHDVKPAISSLGLAKTISTILFQTTVATGVVVAALL